jgi:cation:H+ antiporter
MLENLLIWLGVLVVALVFLIKSSEWMNTSAEFIGLGLGISPFIIGVLLLAIGTSLPELLTSIVAMRKDASEIIVGNVLGSNISNIFLILGVTASLYRRPINLNLRLIDTDLYFMMGATFLFVLSALDQKFRLIEGIIGLVAFGIYIFYVIRESGYQIEEEIEADMEKAQEKAGIKQYVTFVLSVAVLYISSEYTIEAVIELSKLLDIGQEVIATSAVALGTSLPELMVSIVAVRKSNPEMAVGNVLGSNIFNILLVTGVGSLLGTLEITDEILHFVLPVVIGATFLCFFMIRDRRFSRWQGFLFLVLYIYFLIALFTNIEKPAVNLHP